MGCVIKGVLVLLRCLVVVLFCRLELIVGGVVVELGLWIFMVRRIEGFEVLVVRNMYLIIRIYGVISILLIREVLEVFIEVWLWESCGYGY